jgi:hypothetical protein
MQILLHHVIASAVSAPVVEATGPEQISEGLLHGRPGQNRLEFDEVGRSFVVVDDGIASSAPAL